MNEQLPDSTVAATAGDSFDDVVLPSSTWPVDSLDG